MSPIAMTRTFRTALAAVALAGAAFVTAAPSPAHAESGMQRIRTYFKAMDGLTAAVDAWNVDVTTALSAAETKPEVFCSADFLPDLAGAAADFETGKAAYGQSLRLIRYHAARYR
mgnify:CR=1 FL=1